MTQARSVDTGADAFLDLALAAADAARPIVLSYFRKPIDTEHKADESPVTIADREAEAAMRAVIGAAQPGHGIVGEEMGAVRADAEYVWTLDPIDGTNSFVTGNPLFGVLVALARDGVPVLGVMDAPALGERWIGRAGHPTTFNGEAVRTRPCPGLGDAWLYTVSPHYFPGGTFDRFERLRQASRRVVYGGDCLAYGFLAGGRVDLVCEADMNCWDYAALVPIISGAGGIMTDWQGKALTLASGGTVIAAGDAGVHAAALDMLNR